MLMPASAFEALESSQAIVMGRALGLAVGRRIVVRFGGTESLRNSTLELVVDHLAGELSIAGLGAIRLERWGKAMVIVVARPAVGSDELLGAAIAASLETSTGRELACVSLGRQDDVARFFVGSPSTTVSVEAELAKGRHFGEVLAAIQGAKR